MRASLLAAPAFLAALVIPGLGAQAPSAPAAAQASPSAPQSFEVAAVKENKSGQPFIRFGMMPGGRFNAENVPLRELIRFAYQVQPFQMEDGPGWMNSDRFDITAKAEGDIAPTQPGTLGPIQMMMRSLLAERFKLVVHNETKEMPIYALVLARPDGKLGAKLTPSTVDCAAMFAAARRGGPPPTPPVPGERPQCGAFLGPGSIRGGSVPVSQLAQMFSQMVGRIVLDKTGLTGNYDVELSYTPDQMPQGVGGGAPPGAPAGAPQLPPIDPNGPSLTTAVQEQLGLKLDSQRGPVPMLVIDSVERPTVD